MTVDVQTRELTKVYGNVVALDRFSHTFEKSRIHALMGKNGSGKSTLVKILAGVVPQTSGEMALSGQIVDFASPAEALRQRIITVHQELSLVSGLTVTENIFLGRLPERKSFGITKIDWSQAHRQTETLLQDMGLDIAATAVVGDLSIGQQQTIEIAKAMSFAPVLLLLDEPTSALATREVEMLFALLRRLRSHGTTMMYISHRISELAEIADTCTVLRDGRHTGSVEMSDVDNSDIVDMMFGRIAHDRPAGRTSRADKSHPILEVKNLGRNHAFSGIDLTLYQGEILGIAGMLGAGRSELLRSIFGADPIDEGEIAVDGKRIHGSDPRAMSRIGLGYTPENRKELGLVQTHSIHSNLSMASLRKNAPRGFVTEAAERPGVTRQIDQLQIKVDSPADPVNSLSGGNQQKVVIGNWLNTEPKIMFFDEPSRGVDVQAKQQIFKIFWEQAERGLSMIFVSTELEELLEVCDRILIMKEGRILGELDPANTTLSQLYAACMEGL